MHRLRPCITAAFINIFVFTVSSHAQTINAPDTDGDGISDARDNCLLTANADQRDTNDDGYGNACDMDLNNDGVINVVDLGLLRGAFFSADPDADANGDGVVNAIDLGALRLQFFAAPGPTRFFRYLGSGGLWEQPGTWLPARVPGPLDHVLLDGVPGGTLSVAADLEVASIEVLGGSLSGQDNAFSVGDFVIGDNIFFDIYDAEISVSGSAYIGGSVTLDSCILATQPGGPSLHIGPQGNIHWSSGSIDLSSGIVNQGLISFELVSGVLGPVTGSGGLQISNSNFRLVGLHNASYLTNQSGDNIFTLEGTVDGSGAFDSFSIDNDTWSFAPGARLIAVDLFANDFVLDAPANVLFENVDMGGSFAIDPGAALSITGASRFGGTIIMGAPVTTSQPPPELIISGDEWYGSGSIEVASSTLSDLDPVTIIIDAPGSEVDFDNGFGLLIERSTDIVATPNTTVRWQGEIVADGANSVAPQFQILGRWLNFGPIDVRDGIALALPDEFLSIASSAIISVTNASMSVTGDWSNSGQIVLIDSHINFDFPNSGFIGELSLTRSVAKLTGVVAPNAWDEVISDAESTFEFGATFGNSPGLLNVNDLPAGFTLAPGGVFELIDVLGDTPLFASGGELVSVFLFTDLIIRNGATVTARGLTIDDDSIVLEAVDQVTTLRVPGGGQFNGLGGSGDLQFAGSAVSDDLNTLVLNANASVFSPMPFTLRTTTAGGRIVAQSPESSMTIDANIALDAEGRSLSVDTLDADLFLDGNIHLATDSTLAIMSDDVKVEGSVHLGAGATLSVEQSIEFTGGFVTPQIWSTDIESDTRFGRIVSNSFGQLELGDTQFAPSLIGGYVPQDCTSFAVAEDFFYNGNFDAVDTTGLGALNAVMDYGPGLLTLTVFDQAMCN